MTTSTATDLIRTYSHARHVTSDVAMRQVDERYGREEIDDNVAATIASWYQSPSRTGMPFTLLAQGSHVSRSDLLDAIHRERQTCVREDERALDMLASWAINYH